MARDRSVLVRLRASVSEFTGPMREAKKSVEDVAAGAQKSSQQTGGAMSRLAQGARENREAWTQVGGALTTYGAAVTGLGAAVLGVGINYNTLRQRSVAALTTMTGSAEAANAQMDKLDDFASNSPFARDVFIKAQQQLIGFGFEAERVVPILDAIQNAVAATGGSNQDIEELVRIVAQVGAAGKITATDLMQFGQRGVDAATLIGSQMGKTGAQIREEITAGTLDADAAIAALTAGMDERFGGAAANVKGTMLGAVDRVKAAFRDISASFASVLVDPNGGGLLVDGLNTLADGMRAFERLPDPIRNTAGALGLLSGPVALAAGGFLLLAPRAVETVDALRQMGFEIPNAEGKLKGLGTAAGIAVKALGALGLLYALSAAGDAMNDFELSTEEAENRLRTFQDTVSGTDLFSFDIGGAGGFQSLLDDLADDSWWRPLHSNIADLGDGLGSLFGQDTRSDFYKGRDDLLAIDGVLADMAAKSLPDAVEHFGRLVDLTDGSNDSILKLIDVLPGYRDHLVGVANQMGIAADDTTLLKLATGQLKPPVDEAAAALDGVSESAQSAADALALIKAGPLQEEAQGIVDSVGAIYDSLISLDGVNDEELSLDGWLSKIEAEMEAAANSIKNRTFLIGQGVSAEFVDGVLSEQGGDVRVQQMADAVADDIDKGKTGTVDRLNGIGSGMYGDVRDGIVAAATSGDPIVIDAAIELGLARADLQAEADSIFYNDPLQVPVAGDPEPLRQTINDQILWAAELNGIVHFDADGSLATLRLEEWNETARNTTGMPVLDADPQRARQQIADYFAEAADTTGVAILDADGRPATKVRKEWVYDTEATVPVMDIDATTYDAQKRLDEWFRNNAGRTISVAVRASVTSSSVGYQIGLSNANGGFYQYANGGIDDRGRGVPRQSMMGGPAYGRTNILWGEPETGWEAYISGKPGQEARNRAVLEEAAHRMGMTVLDGLGVQRFANGGIPTTMNLTGSPVTGRDVGSIVNDWADHNLRATMLRQTGNWLDLWRMVQPWGVRLTSAWRPGAITATGKLSKHAQGKAIDVSNNYALWKVLEAQKSSFAELYGPWGLWLRGMNRYNLPGAGITARNHKDHMHIAAYGNGGIFENAPKAADTGHLTLDKGWNAVYNGLGRLEHLSEQRGPAGPVTATLAPEDRALLRAAFARPIQTSVQVGARQIAHATHEGDRQLEPRRSWSNAPRIEGRS